MGHVTPWTPAADGAMLRVVQTVYEAAGGRAGLERLAAAWHARVLADEVVSHAFSHGYHPEHVQRLAAYWARALGGPPGGAAACPEESAVARMHACAEPHEEMDRRAVTCFEEAVADVGLDAQPVGAVLVDYFADRTAALARDGEVPDGLPPVRWSWDGPVS